MNKAEEDELRTAAFKLLSRRTLTKRELIDRLTRKGYSSETSKLVTHKLAEKGYINENAIVEDHIRRGREVRLVGRFLLKYELQRRGINQENVMEQLDRLYPECDEIDLALAFIERKTYSISDLPDDKRFKRLGGALQRRGFSAEVITNVMRKFNWGMDKEHLTDNEC